MQEKLIPEIVQFIKMNEKKYLKQTQQIKHMTKCDGIFKI